MCDALRIHDPNALLRELSCLHTAERAKGRDYLKRQSLVLPDDKRAASRVAIAEKLARAEVAIGNPEVLRLHRAQDRAQQRALLRVAIFTGKDVADQAPHRFIDHERLTRQSTRGNPAQFFETMLTRFDTVAVDNLHPVAGMHRGLNAKDDLTQQVIDR